MYACVCARERECVIAGMRESGGERKGGHWTIGSCFCNTNIKKRSYLIFCAAIYNFSGARPSGWRS